MQAEDARAESEEKTHELITYVWHNYVEYENPSYVFETSLIWAQGLRTTADLRHGCRCSILEYRSNAQRKQYATLMIRKSWKNLADISSRRHAAPDR